MLCPAVDKRDLPVALGGARLAGWGFGRGGETGMKVLSACGKSPLLTELDKRTWNPTCSDGSCIGKLIPLSLPSGMQIPSLGAGRRRALEMPRGSRAGQGGEQGHGGLFSFKPESHPQAPNCLHPALIPREKPCQVLYKVARGRFGAHGPGQVSAGGYNFHHQPPQRRPCASLPGAWTGSSILSPQFFWPK